VPLEWCLWAVAPFSVRFNALGVSDGDFNHRGNYGVRCMVDYWGDNERKTEPNTLAQLEELEFVLSAEYPYKLLARFFQVIAQKA